MDIKAFRGLSGTYNVRANERNRRGSCSTPRNIECLVQFLNNTQHRFIIDKRSKGQCLLDCVFRHLNLIETDFFGLKYFPGESQNCDISNHINLNNTTNNTNHQNNTNNNNTVLSNTTQPYNSYDHHQHHHNHHQSPSPNESLSSSTITSEPSNSNNINGNNNNNISNNNNNRNSNNESPNAAIDISNISSEHDYHQDNNNIIRINGRENNNNNKHSDNNNLPTTICPENGKTKSTLHEERWLDPTKSITKQYKPGLPYVFFFRVKFYVSDPCKLADDTTRYHLYLQLRQDILNNRLVVPDCSALLLASYILQSEVGDYRRELLESDYASNFELLPKQDDDIKKKVIELHKKHKSLSAADAEYQFLMHAATKLDCYGVEFFDAKDLDKITSVRIGVSSNGIVVIKDNKKMDQFMWAKIVKIMFKKKIFSIQLRRDDGVICDNFIEYNLLTNHACKSFWEECVAQHSFFRLHQPKNPPKKFFSFLNFGSKFQYNGKTEYQTMEESRKRSFSHFSRTPSKRYARRTIPVGRPSWSSPTTTTTAAAATTTTTSNDTSDSTDRLERNEQPISAMSVESCETNAVSRHISRDGTSSASPSTTADHGKTIHNGYSDSKSRAYRPKSLTLKSIMYIDEPKINNTQTNNHHHQQQNNTIDSVDNDNSAQADDTRTNNVLKRDLKRCESLRIPSSIRDAISLTKKAGASSSNQLARISESLKDKFLARKSKYPQEPYKANHSDAIIQSDSDDLEIAGCDETKNSKVVRIHPDPGKGGKYGFKIREVTNEAVGGRGSKKAFKRGTKSKLRQIVIHDVTPDSPAATNDPPLCEGDLLVSINGISTTGLSDKKVVDLIRRIHKQDDAELVLEILPINNNAENSSLSTYASGSDGHSSPSFSNKTLAESIADIKRALNDKTLEGDFEKLSRRKEDESLSESRAMENIDKNRYQDILPYDSTRVQLSDSMTGDYINASFVDMAAPNGMLNRYIATQGPLPSTCDDFWQMIWEQNCSLIIMVTPLIEAGRVKCHKYWPNEKEETKYGQLLIRNLSEKSKVATIDRTIQLLDVKSGEKRLTTQIQYRSWPDHQVPADCSDFLKLVSRVRKHRASKPEDPIVVHCSAGIGRTGVLILMETAICIMEAGEPIYPLRILEDMRRKRAMLIQTSDQFKFVAGAICKVYYQKLYKKSRKYKKK